MISYTYDGDGGDPITVPAGADGTASVVYTPTAYSNNLTVTGNFADGTGSMSTFYCFFANPPAS